MLSSFFIFRPLAVQMCVTCGLYTKILYFLYIF